MGQAEFIQECRDRGSCVVERPPFIYVFEHLEALFRVHTEFGRVDHVTSLPPDIWTDLFICWLEHLDRKGVIPAKLLEPPGE